MIRYFFGPDSWAARAAITELAVSYQAQLQFLDRSDIEKQSLESRLSQGNGDLFGKRLWVVRDPLSFPKSIQSAWADFVKEDVRGEAVLWDRGVGDKRSGLWKALKDRAQEFSYPSDQSLSAWLVLQAKERGGMLDEAAAQEMVRRIGQDRWQLLSELHKLLLTKEQIGVAHVREEVWEREAEANSFQFLDAAMAGNRQRAMMYLEQLLVSESEFRILALLAYQMRVMVLISGALSQGMRVAEIARTQKLHPFVVEKNIPLVSRVSGDILLGMYARLLATDFSIKQGIVDPRTGLTMLALALSEAMQRRAVGT